jgi:hypothetical protein
LNVFATQAHAKFLKKAKGVTSVPEELFTFEASSSSSKHDKKRSRQKTQRLKESEEQEDSCSTSSNKKTRKENSESEQDGSGMEKRLEENEKKEKVAKKKLKTKKVEVLPEKLKSLQSECSLLSQFTSSPSTTPPMATYIQPDLTTTPPLAHTQQTVSSYIQPQDRNDIQTSKNQQSEETPTQPILPSSTYIQPLEPMKPTQPPEDIPLSQTWEMCNNAINTIQRCTSPTSFQRTLPEMPGNVSLPIHFNL